jgi:hypothetical protein
MKRYHNVDNVFIINRRGVPSPMAKASARPDVVEQQEGEQIARSGSEVARVDDDYLV